MREDWQLHLKQARDDIKLAGGAHHGVIEGGKASIGMYQDVDARALGFAQLDVTPAFVSSVYTQSGEWMLTGETDDAT